MTPRRCQLDAVAAAHASIMAGSPDVIEMVTRSGKSIAMALLLLRLRREGWTDDRHVVVVTSRSQLVHDLRYTMWRMLDPSAQAVPGREHESREALRACAASAVVGQWDGGRKRIAPIVVTTYPSLRGCIEALGGAGRVRLLLCDEAHRSRAEQAGELVRSIPCRIGWTATPYPGEIGARLPGWARVAYRYGPTEAIEDGVIVGYEPRWWTGDRVEQARAVEAAIELLDGIDGPGLVTAPDLVTAVDYARQLTEAGISAVAAVRRSKVYPEGLTGRQLRALYRQTRTGEVRALVTVDLLAEGVTIPWLRWIALCAKPRGRIHLVQVVGRVLGTCTPDMWGQKARAYVVDPCGVLRRYRLEHPAALGEDGRRERPMSPRRAAEVRARAVAEQPWAEYVTSLEVWSMAILVRCRTWAKADVAREKPLVKPSMRALDATDLEMDALRRMRPLVRWLSGDEGHRRQVEAVMDSARVPAGVVADLRLALGHVAARRHHLLRTHGRLVQTVQGHCSVAGVALPEVGVFSSAPLDGHGAR